MTPVVLQRRRELDQVLGDRAVRAVYQPIVELSTGKTVAFEALARGPAGSGLERPDLLFAEARAAGRLSELDWLCRTAAIAGALEAGLDRAVPLFINVEPEAIGSGPTRSMQTLLRDASDALSVVVEITERALVSSPAALLRALAYIRGLGWGVALDDVGAEVASLALMPFLRPDVIKLDLRLIQQQPDGPLAAIIGAVDAQAERTGAQVLAEGIETAFHRETALAMGATLGQGWLFGPPGAISEHARPMPGRLASPGRALPPAESPIAAAAAGRPTRRSTKPLLLEMSRHLERQALQQGTPAVVLGAFQTADRFTPATASRYRQLAERAAFVAALGVGMPLDPAPGVRGGALRRDDPLVDEWAVAIVGPHFAAALAATDLGDTGPDDARRFDYVLTYDRLLVLTIADSLMARVVAIWPRWDARPENLEGSRRDDERLARRVHVGHRRVLDPGGGRGPGERLVPLGAGGPRPPVR